MSDQINIARQERQAREANMIEAASVQVANALRGAGLDVEQLDPTTHAGAMLHVRPSGVPDARGYSLTFELGRGYGAARPVRVIYYRSGERVNRVLAKDRAKFARDIATQMRQDDAERTRTAGQRARAETFDIATQQLRADICLPAGTRINATPYGIKITFETSDSAKARRVIVAIEAALAETI